MLFYKNSIFGFWIARAKDIGCKWILLLSRFVMTVFGHDCFVATAAIYKIRK